MINQKQMKKLLLLLLFLGFLIPSTDAQIFKKRSRTVTTQYEMVDSLPESIPYGHQVLYNGTMWRGLVEGESSLPAGTPWPVKGYKEIIYNSLSNSNPIKNDFPQAIKSIVDNEIRINLGEPYAPTVDHTYGVLSSDRIQGPGTAATSRGINPTSNGIIVELNDFSGTQITSLLENFNGGFQFRIYPPPPTP